MRSSQRIRQTLRKYQRKPVTQQGILGNEVGDISVPNRVDYVYVRVAGLGTISIYNKRVPLILDLPVDVGYDPLEPKNFQVLNIHRYPQGGGRGLVDVSTILHGKTHNWAGIDPVFIEKRQLMPLRPTPLGGMQIYVTREVTYYDDKAVQVTGQQLDLTPYVPATGSWLVLLYKDTDELIKVSTGGVLRDIFSLSMADAPQVYPGTVPIALVRLYGGQSGIAEGYQDTDLIDVRQLFSPIDLTGTSSGSGGHIIQDEGVSRTQRTNLNFKGALVWAIDNAGADSTDIIISGTSSGVSTGTALADHDHSGDAGDGGQFVLTNLTSGAATDGQVATADGLGNVVFRNKTPVVMYSIGQVSQPPTQADIVNAFGSAATAGKGFAGIIDDRGLGLNFYMCVSDGSKWWYSSFAKGESPEVVVEEIALAEDTFTDSNGTNLADHTMDVGDGWTESLGDWTIQGNIAQQNDATGGYKVAITDAGTANVKIKASFKMTGTETYYEAGIVGRFSDTSNSWQAYYAPSDGKFRLVTQIAGVSTVVDDVNWTALKQKWIDIEVTFEGDTVTAQLNGGFTLTYTSSFNNTVTNFGIFEYRDTYYKANNFENFQVVDIPIYEFTKWGNVLTPSYVDEDGWVSESILQFGPAKLLTGSVFQLWYHGGWSAHVLRYAESADGLSWTKKADALFSGYLHGTVYKDTTQYIYIGVNESTNQYDLLTSPDGLVWTLDTANILTHGGAGTWDSTYWGSPFIWKEGSTYYMLYEASNAGYVWQIGLATSSNLTSWTKSGSNPLIANAGRPSVQKIDTTYYLWAHTYADTGEGGVIGRWRSTDLAAWEKYPFTNMITRTGTDLGINLNTGFVSEPAPLIYNGALYVIYSNGTEETEAAGDVFRLATADARLFSGW